MSDIFTTKAYLIANGCVARHGMDPGTVGASLPTPGPFIQLLISLLPTLLPMLIGCITPPAPAPAKATPAEILAAMQNLNLLQRMLLSREVRKEVGGNEFMPFVRPIVTEIQTMCKGCTEADVVAAQEAIAA